MTSIIPKLSVCVVTYNHEKYIRECLESIVTQKCDFDFEVIVGEDCSTDGTKAIVQEYADKYPELIKPVFHTTNIGAYNNYYSIMHKIQGEYFAYIDGDDYMFQGKLSEQVKFLDDNQDFNIVWHNMISIDSITGEIIKSKHANSLKIYQLKDILVLGSVGSNSSKMARSACVLLNDMTYKKYFDFCINIFEIADKKACLLPQTLGAYNAYVTVTTLNNRGRRIQYLNNLLHLVKKFPLYRSEIGAQLIFLTIHAFKNNRDIFKDHFHAVMQTANFKSIFYFFKYHVIKRYFND